MTPFVRLRWACCGILPLLWEIILEVNNANDHKKRSNRSNGSWPSSQTIIGQSHNPEFSRRDLAKGNRLEFRDFGVFEVRETAPRIAQNPKTLEPVEVPAKQVVKFKAGRLMKQGMSASRHVGVLLTKWQRYSQFYCRQLRATGLFLTKSQVCQASLI